MSLIVLLLRALSLQLLATPMLLAPRASRHTRHAPNQVAGRRFPVLANFGAFIVFFPTLFILAGRTHDLAALVLGIAGCVIAAAGSALVSRSRAALGPAWSLVPK